MRMLAIMLGAVAVAGCNLAPRDVRVDALQAYDLTSSAVTVDLIAALDEADRPVFRQFLLHHLATSSAFCGEALFDEAGQAPKTVGDAIRLTRLREERLAAAGRPFDLASLSPQARKNIKLRQLSDKRGELKDMIATAEMIGSSTNVAEHRRQIAQLNAQIEQLGGKAI